MTPEEALRRLGGVARRSEVVAVAGRRGVDEAVAAGRLVAVGRSSLVLPDIADHRVAQALGGSLGGLSAAVHHGWKVKKPPRRPVVIVGRNRSRVRADVDVVRRDLPAGATRGHVLRPVPTVLHCALSLPFDEAVCVADSALRSERVTKQELLDAARLMQRPGRCIEVMEFADGRAANPFESVPRVIARDVPGLALVPQLDVDGIGHADLVDPLLRIVVECDSWEFHSLPERFRYDVRRYTEMTLADWMVIRLVWGDVMATPEKVREILARAVRLAERRRAA